MNSDVIRLLPDSVANQIAAGEVIQRPASVIKELVENSVDAGASTITIVLKDAGRTLIQVVDDGCGMSPTDARMAFERHATSKITSAGDLYSLHTMGFRGEALPSIAAVAQIELRTMRKGDQMGTRLLLSEGECDTEPTVCTPGTSLSVKNIFYRMPARRKFLKKDSVELCHILREFEKLALVNTDIDFTLIHNDVTLHKFMRGSFKQRIGSLFGKTLESQLAPVSTETSIVKISGFIGLPRFARKRGAQQFFFVNGRNMRHPFFHKAVVKCYEQLVQPESQPSYFINFEVDPASIDVNIHPQKHEIKFEHEQAIFQIIEAAVRETLGKTQAAGALDFDQDQAPEIPLFNPDINEDMPWDGADNGFDPFAAGLRAAGEERTSPRPLREARQSFASQVPADWEKLYENFSRRRDESYEELRSGMHEETPESGQPELFGGEQPQMMPAVAGFSTGNGYIVNSTHGGVMFIAQQRAHIRILYERFMKMMDDGPLASQQLIFAEDVELSPAQSALLQAMSQQVEALGFKVRQSDGCNWCIEAVPAIHGRMSPGESLQALLEALGEEGVDGQSYRSPAAFSMARSAAIGARQPLTPLETDNIVAELFRCDSPNFTPDGLPVFFIVGYDEMEQRLS